MSFAQFEEADEGVTDELGSPKCPRGSQASEGIHFERLLERPVALWGAFWCNCKDFEYMWQRSPGTPYHVF